MNDLTVVDIPVAMHCSNCDKEIEMPEDVLDLLDMAREAEVDKLLCDECDPFIF